ncbi:LuxR C-terminal-related transcriptional regulator [Streptomyces sp. NPDC006326]|uniref:ATP-binding protein n=1 Tax=Streptomyces sp. NPDC006326 TaxID=3156752 RepID=UPI0033AF642D
MSTHQAERSATPTPTPLPVPASGPASGLVPPAPGPAYAPLGPAPAVAHRFAAADGLVGREAELDALEGRLADPRARLVTVTGPAGVGKSRLVAVAAERLAGAFDEVRTDARTGSQGLDGTAGAGRRTLLVLDGAEACADEVAALLARVPGLTVLATGLQPVGVYGEQLVPLAPLPLPRPADAGDPHALARVPSVELFVRRAAEACPGFALTADNARDTAALCTLLEGLPLALELAAGRMRLYPPGVLLARLGGRPCTLSGGPASAPARHRSLDALAEWSCRSLDAQARALLERLAGYEPGFGAVALGRSDGPALDTLLDRGLLRLVGEDHADARYAVPEPVRSHLRGVQEDAGRAGTAADDHADRYARLAASAASRLTGTDQARWLAVHSAEAPNVQAALDRLWTRGDRAGAAAMAVACGEPWLAQGRLRPGLGWCDRLLEAGGLPDPVAARLADLSGVLAAALGDAPDAVRRHRSALALCKPLGDRRHTAQVTAHLGAALLAAGDPQGALAALEPAAAALEAVGAAGPAARAGTALAATLHALGRDRRAAQALEGAVGALRWVGDDRGLAEALRLSAALTGGDDPDAADALLREGLRRCREIGERTVLPLVLEEFALHVLRVTPAQQPRVVRLLAASAALREGLGARAPQEHESAVEQARKGVLSRLGWTAYSTAWAEGWALGPAEAVLEALSSPAPAARTDSSAARASGEAPRTLTPRQVQVAMLVAEGLTNRQIAERLGLSEWTVVNHVRQIMRRLGCSSRIQVAWAIGQWS